MKYTLQGTCECPRELFIQYLIQPDHMTAWQESLISHKALHGAPGRAGSKARMIHKYGKRQVEMIETIEAANLPDAMTAIYEAPGAWNRVEFRFSDEPTGGTKWSMESEFRCTGMLKAMTILFPGMFRRTSRKEMESLKAYAEREAERAGK